MITGVNHVTLSVRDLDVSFDFYTKILGIKPRAKWLQGAYLEAGKIWLALIVDKKMRTHNNPEYSHLALSVKPKDFGPISKRIRESGAKIWHRNTTEGPSIYFLDPDGHKLEIHVGDLKTRLIWAKTNPWKGLEFFNNNYQSQ